LRCLKKKLPWQFQDEKKVKEVVCNGNRPLFSQNSFENKETEIVAEIATACWEGMPNDRPTFENIVKVLDAECGSQRIKCKTQVNTRTNVVVQPTISNQSTRVIQKKQ